MQAPVISKELKYQNVDIFLQKIVSILALVNDIELSIGAKALIGYYMKYGCSKQTDKLFSINKKATNKWYVYNLRVELKKANVLIQNEDTNEWELSFIFNIPLDNIIGLKYLISYHEL